VASDPSASSNIVVHRFSTDDLPPEQRHETWVARDEMRIGRVFRTAPTEPFSILEETVSLSQLLFGRVEITAMTWERSARDIRTSSFDPILVNMMVEGQARGDLDGRAFLEPAGSYHFHDPTRPSLHASTASLTYSLLIPREIAAAWFSPMEELHGLVVSGELARSVLDLAVTAWSLLPSLDLAGGARIERAFLELLALGFEAARSVAPPRLTSEELLKVRVFEMIEQRLDLNSVTVADLCRILEVSTEQLAAAFRGDGGLKAWLLHRRLESARAALTRSDRVEPIGNIAHRLGFSDAAHLSRAFRQRYGLSPRDYRRLAEIPQ
jgi:AraC-like DNA-binding protein